MHTALAAVTRELLLFRHDKHHPANFYTANLYNDNYGFFKIFQVTADPGLGSGDVKRSNDRP